MNDYFMQKLARQRERELLEEFDAIRRRNVQQAGGRAIRKKTPGRMKSGMTASKRVLRRIVSRWRELMDPLREMIRRCKPNQNREYFKIQQNDIG